MNQEEYWRECIACAAEECDLVLTPEQVNYLAEAVQGSHENYGMAFYQPESPHKGEVQRLERELSKEKSKVPCTECAGQGRIIIQGPYHSCNSQCWKCRGDGKVLP